MTNSQAKYIDIVIRNTEILSEFTNLVKRIEILVENLPDNKDYKLHQQHLNYIKENIDDLVILYKSNLEVCKSNDDKIDKIPSLCTSIEDIKDGTNACDKIINKIESTVQRIEKMISTISEWAKVKLPLTIGFITLVIYAIGFYINFKYKK